MATSEHVTVFTLFQYYPGNYVVATQYYIVRLAANKLIRLMNKDGCSCASQGGAFFVQELETRSEWHARCTSTYLRVTEYKLYF